MSLRSRIAADDHPARAGFTLIEVLLVLALIVVIAAIVWPALDKPFAAGRLRASADQLRAELARGRVAAMSSGQVYVLNVEPTTGRFQLVAADASASPAPSAGATTQSGAATPTGLTLGRPLPEGIRLQELLAVDDVTPPPQLSTTQPPAAAAAAAASAPTPPASGPNAGGVTAAPLASSPIYFHPDGSTSSARFTLVNEHGAVIQLELRGLTGATRVVEPAATTGAAP